MYFVGIHAVCAADILECISGGCLNVNVESSVWFHLVLVGVMWRANIHEDILELTLLFSFKERTYTIAQSADFRIENHCHLLKVVLPHGSGRRVPLRP